MGRTEFVGVDWASCGWFSVGFTGNGEYTVRAFVEFEDLLTYYQAARLILVDIPIGLPPGPESRECDAAARDAVGTRHSCVFTTPTQHTVDYSRQHPDDANGIKRVELCHTQGSEKEARSVNSQTLSIMRQIANVDEVLLARNRPPVPQVREVHPEVLFWALNGAQPGTEMQHPKKNKSESIIALGVEERVAVLLALEPRTNAIREAARQRYTKGRVGDDDILDALAAAITAYLGHRNLQTLPAAPPVNAAGLTMEMVYWTPP
jgi:predicted RNase H-like nuclease